LEQGEVTERSNEQIRYRGRGARLEDEFIPKAATELQGES
jgi:hypothetical protein